jgi:transposase-like protein
VGPVANFLEDARDRLFTFTRLPLGQWRNARTTNAIERLRTSGPETILLARVRRRVRAALPEIINKCAYVITSSMKCV